MNRRDCIACMTVLAVSLIGASQAMGKASTAFVKQHTLLIVGDSLSAEYGIKRGTGWVALLEAKLATEQIAAKVINASISGDTTAGGRAHLPVLLEKHRPTVVVIELGANDALRGLPLAMTRDNLTVMIKAAQRFGARVLLLGIQIPPNYGRDYSVQFAQVFADVSRACQTPLVPFLLKGVADVPDNERWFQADRLHPVAAAHPIILNNVWPALRKELQ